MLKTNNNKKNFYINILLNSNSLQKNLKKKIYNNGK